MRMLAPYIFGIAFALTLGHAVVDYTNTLLAIGIEEITSAYRR